MQCREPESPKKRQEAEMCTSDGVLIAVMNKGRRAKVGIHCPGGLYIFAVNVWRSEGWTSRNEALMQAVLQQTAEESPRLIARDADMAPRQSGEGDGYNETEAVGQGAYKKYCHVLSQRLQRWSGGEVVPRLCQLQVQSNQCWSWIGERILKRCVSAKAATSEDEAVERQAQSETKEAGTTCKKQLCLPLSVRREDAACETRKLTEQDEFDSMMEGYEDAECINQRQKRAW